LAGHGFPIVLGRPVLLAPGSLSEWVPPVDEALGIRSGSLPASLEALASMGAENALDRLRSAERAAASEPTGSHGGDALRTVSEELLRKARYRKYGGWFRHGGRDRLLGAAREPIPETKAARSPLERIVAEVIDVAPARILDVASGGGFAIARLLHYMGPFDYAVATERDLRCLWSMECKLRIVDARGIAEPIGADVRRLPLADGSFDLAMCNQSFGELLGIRRMLREVHRALEPGGMFLVTYAARPWLFGRIEEDDYARFARAADLFSGFEDFISDAEAEGFATVGSELWEHDGREFFLVTFRKRPAKPGSDKT
jgi:SAM-dependent methyltransferase